MPQPLMSEAIWMILSGLLLACCDYLGKEMGDSTQGSDWAISLCFGFRWSQFFIPLIILFVAGVSVTWEFPVFERV